jgi:transcriptional regulator with XRE-family HTH domain
MKSKKKSFVETIKEAIDTSDMTHYQIAQQSGVSKTIISRFMSGERSISLENAERICDLLGVVLTKAK